MQRKSKCVSDRSRRRAGFSGRQIGTMCTGLFVARSIALAENCEGVQMMS